MAEYPIRIICDTSVYIPFINQGIAHPVFSDEPLSPVLYMSIVVLSELFAGAHDSQSIKLLNRLYHSFDSVGRLIVPAARDWQQTGGVISKMRTKYGFDRQYLARIQNDILIAESARRIGGLVVTKNEKDFKRIKEFVDFRLYYQ